MSVNHRQELILQRIAAGGSVKSTELAARFAVTQETVRKDLETLAKENRILRTHGGATRKTRSDAF